MPSPIEKMLNDTKELLPKKKQPRVIMFMIAAALCLAGAILVAIYWLQS